MQSAREQNKQKEVEFFDRLAEEQTIYDVFTPQSTGGLVQTCVDFAGFRPGARLLDLGCGSGVFTQELAVRGFEVTGIDLSPKLIRSATAKYPHVEFQVGDVERLNIPDQSVDGVLLSGLVHHLPEPKACVRELWRILKPGAAFVAFDPNRRNPFMWLYRDRSSPLYSSKGVTENERPILASELRSVCETAGFDVQFRYLSGLKYQYVESRLARTVLPVYNFLDSWLCRNVFDESRGTFIITRGTKPPHRGH